MATPSECVIHPTAIVDERASLGEGVQIGPRCTIEGPVEIGDGVRLIGDVHLRGPARIGPRTVIYPYACLGFEPQDRKFGPDSVSAGVTVGSDTLIREHVTIHQSTSPEVPTSIGSNVMMMVASHVGHDCRLGDRVTVVNAALIAGHIQIADDVTVSGGGAIHQFVRVGRHAFISGMSAITQDVPPFCIVSQRNRINGINRVGLRRAGFAREDISALHGAFRTAVVGCSTRDQMLEELDRLSVDRPLVAEMAEFIRGAKRGICGASGRAKGGRSNSVAEDVLS